VVAIGGGTGLSTLLRGLRKHVAAGVAPDAPQALISELAAVVSVTDDGGSSGRLRQQFDMLPPGDLRNCMVALSEEEDVLARLFSHRFRGGESLKDHSFGNLFVAALTEITGDFAHAIQLASKILATRGRIYPVTTAKTALVARMSDGSIVRGETNINGSHKGIAELMLDPPDPAPLPETIEAIERADLISVGPGSLYTSLITNLLVQDMTAALARARGVRVFVCNLMTEANESLGLTALRLRSGQHRAFLARNAGSLCRRRRCAHRCRHGTHRSSRSALHCRRFCQRRWRGPSLQSRRRRASSAGQHVSAASLKSFSLYSKCRGHVRCVRRN
jgi:uncharacterized cofD-like protein